MLPSRMFRSSHVIFRLDASRRASMIEKAYTPCGKLPPAALPVAVSGGPTSTLPPICQKPFVCPAILLCGPSECPPPTVLGIQYPSQFVTTSDPSPLLPKRPNRNCSFPQLNDVFVTKPEKLSRSPTARAYPCPFVPNGAYKAIPAPPQL